MKEFFDKEEIETLGIHINFVKGIKNSNV